MQKSFNRKLGITIVWVAVFYASVLVCPFAASSAPVISSVNGTIANNQSITISGSGFGSTGPTIILFDDFELGTNGLTLSEYARNAQVGTWRQKNLGGYYGTYSNLGAHSGSLSFRQNWGSGGDGQEGQRWAAPAFASSFSKIYFSFWTYLPAGQNVPSGGIGPNWKVWWLSTNDVFQNDYASEIVTDPPNETSICYVDGSIRGACWGYDRFTFTKGRWLRWEAYLVASTSASGAVYLWHTDSGNARHLTGSDTGATIDSGTTGWQYLHFPGYGRYDTNSNTYYDDIYVAVGEGALARVEIGNNATYSNCTNLAVITPTSWSNTSITATVRLGSFTAGRQAYLFLVDSTGTSSSGYPIFIGEGGGGDIPSSPSGLRIVQ